MVMRRIISALLSVMIVSGITAPFSYAEEENPDLAQLASSLGADTDMFSFPNYYFEEGINLPDEVYENFMLRSLNSELVGGNGAFVMSLSSGHCLGIALLEVLSHNGMIEPSDIQEGAETLNEITYDEGVDKYISDYHILQNHLELAICMGKIDEQYSYEEKTDLLIETAERCMANDRYFLITIKNDSFHHAVAGIGIAEGSWEFDGEVYDKCILTIDSNARTREEKAAFTEKCCIYIDSVSRKLYIPAYAKYADGGAFIVTPSDDMYSLNYKGTLGVNDRLGESIASTCHFAAYGHKYYDYTITVTDRDGNEELLDNEKHLAGDNIKSYIDASKIEVKMDRNDEPTDIPLNEHGNASIAGLDKWITYFGLNFER